MCNTYMLVCTLTHKHTETHTHAYCKAKKTLQAYTSNSYVCALVHNVENGGKPSTRFPPEGLVEKRPTVKTKILYTSEAHTKSQFIHDI